MLYFPSLLDTKHTLLALVCCDIQVPGRPQEPETLWEEWSSSVSGWSWNSRHPSTLLLSVWGVSQGVCSLLCPWLWCAKACGEDCSIPTPPAGARWLPYLLPTPAPACPMGLQHQARWTAGSKGKTFVTCTRTQGRPGGDYMQSKQIQFGMKV
jgi:hypothetical protein